MNFNDFKNTVREAFPEVSGKQLEQFGMMEEVYRDWNSKINVISRKDLDGIYSHHVLHSLAIARYLRERKLTEYSEMALPDNGLKVLDLGTGGGFPGIPLAVMFPEVRFVLCDSIRKKTIVAEAVAKHLGLENVEVVNARAESLGIRFDYVVSCRGFPDGFLPLGQGLFRQKCPLSQGRGHCRGDCKTDGKGENACRQRFHLEGRQLARR